MRTSLLSLVALALAAPAYATSSNILTTHDTVTSTVTTTDGDTTTETTTSSDATLTTRTHPPRMDPNFPYDSTEGENRGDIDTERHGFDDPRDPWDGRYSNDNPNNYTHSGAETGITDSSRPDLKYAPGAFGTHAVHNDHGDHHEHHHDD